MSAYTPPDEQLIEEVLSRVKSELLRAIGHHKPINSPHEGYAVIAEKLDELWDEVKANERVNALDEAIQVSAMGARFVVDLWQGESIRA